MATCLSTNSQIRLRVSNIFLVRANFLFDMETLQISSILDWDLAHIAAPVSEYFHGFGDVHGFLTSRYEEMKAFRCFKSPSNLTNLTSGGLHKTFARGISSRRANLKKLKLEKVEKFRKESETRLAAPLKDWGFQSILDREFILYNAERVWYRNMQNSHK
jgi:hypothetical protein